VRYFTVPDKSRFDFLRHTGILSYKQVLSNLWQVQIGYENINAQFPDNPSLDYSVNGGFVEVRNTWDFNLSSYYSYDLQFYEGTANPQENNPNAAPEDGLRQTVRLGFDGLFSARHVVSGTYVFQDDRSEFEHLFGDFEGQEGSQDQETEFNLSKHKATLLYSYRPSSRITLSAYEEWIYKNFDDEEHGEFPREGRTDFLFLSSIHSKIKLTDDVLVKLRYLFRLNQSSLASEDYVDHIVFIGPAYAF
jgi:hypothetical protein